MKRLLFIIGLLALGFIGGITLEAGNLETGRWKTDGSGGCYWDPNDDGPNQCWPSTGRWKLGGGGSCYWDANDGGPNQCNPQVPLTEPPPGAEVPQATGNETPEVIENVGLGDNSNESALPLMPSCAAKTLRGNSGYISVQVNTANRTLHWGAYMYSWFENYGPWAAAATLTGHESDWKAQMYPPHGSFENAMPLQIFLVSVSHTYLKQFWSWQWNPLFERYIPQVRVQPTLAYGSLRCFVP